MIAFETDVHIDCPIDEVFAYVSDPLNFPHCLMERELATGRAVNELEVVASRQPCEFGIRATAGPTPFLYRYRFTTENGETVVELDAHVELPSAAALLPALARRAVKKGVDENLLTLKHVLEAVRR